MDILAKLKVKPILSQKEGPVKVQVVLPKKQVAEIKMDNITFVDKRDQEFNIEELNRKLQETKMAKVTVKKTDAEIEKDTGKEKEKEKDKKSKVKRKTTVLFPEDKKLLTLIDEGEEEREGGEEGREGEEEREEMMIKKRSRRTEKVKRGVVVLSPSEWANIEGESVVARLPPKQPNVTYKVPSYYMNNREIFSNFINSLFDNYDSELMDDSKQITCDTIKQTSETVSLLTHQKIVRDYINLYTPYRGLLLYHGLGAGKCHAFNTPIIMSDGTIKMVQDIKEGELLMGDDSTSRTVLSLAGGQDEMYDIIPVKGETYRVNQEHVLCLKASGFPKLSKNNHKANTNYNIQWIENNRFMSKTFTYNHSIINDEEEKQIMANKFFEDIKQNPLTSNNIIEIAVKDYIKLSDKKKGFLKGYKVPLDFPEKVVPLDPYMLGYWLGDGCTYNTCITSQDSTVLHYFHKQLPKYNVSLIYKTDYTYNIAGDGRPNNNLFLNVLKDLNLIKNKHIPHIYKCNSRENRLKLLAGLLDSDGHLSHNGGFEFTQKNERMMEDVIYLARSLGFSCYKKVKQTSWTYKGVKQAGSAFRIHINGSGLDQIPTLIPRKRSSSRSQIKDVLVTGITVKHVGRDNYYGFTLDKNNRYVMGDFTVTHNTLSSIAIAEGLKENKKVIILTPASLHPNYVSELKKGGDALYKLNQCWEWISTKENPNLLDTLSSVLHLSADYINKRGGAWLVNVKKTKSMKGGASSDLEEVAESGIEAEEELDELGTKSATKGKKETKKDKEEQKKKTMEEEDEEEEEEGKISCTYDRMSPKEKVSLDEQITEMIESKYRFIHYNGLRRSKLKEMTSNFSTNLFDNTVVIIDEAHNFISRIVNKIEKEKEIPVDRTGKKETVPLSLAVNLYEMLMSAKDARIVLLTGTPIINYPNEIGILFNILRGYIKTWEFPLNVKGSKSVTLETISEILKRERNMDYVEYSASSKKLLITRNPFGFENVESREKKYSGVSGEDRERKAKDGSKSMVKRGQIGDADFERHIIRLLQENDIEVIPSGIVVHLYKALPDKFEDFMNRFIDVANGNLKNEEMFKKRIIGLTSYFRSAQEELLPRYEKLTDFHVIKIPMSEYQFGIYEAARKEERKQEKSNKTKKGKVDENGVFKEPSSTYRIFSRLYCNFVMPKPPGRPLPREEKEEAVEGGEGVEGAVSLYADALKQGNKQVKDLDEKEEGDGIVEGDVVIEQLADSTYNTRIQDAIKYVEDRAAEYLSKTGLEMYSPKYLHMLENIQDPDNIGLHLVYSQFRTLEGIGMFTRVLDQNGFTQFKIRKGATGEFEVDISEENKGKPTYALYTGTESSEEKETLRKIFNSSWNELPVSLATELKTIAHNNNIGDIIKVFMITASGSEGINLRNTRFVHIMEPYWHPVRMEQVIGRARRICSHNDLPLKLQTIEVFVYLMTFTEEQIKSDKSIELKQKDLSKQKYQLSPEKPDKTEIPFTSDEALYEISTMKEALSSKLLTAVKESSIDCAIHTKKGNKEQLHCLQFGQPKSTAFSYKPSIGSEEPDSVAKLNKEKITWKGKVVNLKGKDYIYRKMDETNANLYDLKSYQDAQENPGVQPRLIGTLKKNERGEQVFTKI